MRCSPGTVTLLSAMMTCSIGWDPVRAEDPGTALLNWVLDAKEAAENPLSVSVTPGDMSVKGAGQVVKAVAPALSAGATAVNVVGMASDLSDIDDYRQKRANGTATAADAWNAADSFGGFVGKTGVPVVSDLAEPMKRVVGTVAVDSLMLDKITACGTDYQCVVATGTQKQAYLLSSGNRQVQEYSSADMMAPLVPSVAKDAATLGKASVRAGTGIAERIGGAVDEAAGSFKAGVASGATSLGNWWKENSPSTFEATRKAFGLGENDAEMEKLNARIAAAEAQLTPSTAAQEQTSLPALSPPTAESVAAPVVARPVATAASGNAPQVKTLPATQKQPTSAPPAPAQAAPSPAASGQPVGQEMQVEWPWQQQERADAAAAAAIAAEQPSVPNQGQPAVGGMQSDQIWYDGSDGFGGLYELDPKLKAQQAVDYAESNYPSAVELDGEPFGMQPRPDPFGDLVPDPSEAMAPEEPAQSRDIPPEPVEQAASDDDNFDSLSSDSDPYTAPRQPRNTNRSTTGRRTWDCRAVDYGTPNPGSGGC